MCYCWVLWIWLSDVLNVRRCHIKDTKHINNPNLYSACCINCQFNQNTWYFNILSFMHNNKNPWLLSCFLHKVHRRKRFVLEFKSRVQFRFTRTDISFQSWYTYIDRNTTFHINSIWGTDIYLVKRISEYDIYSHICNNPPDSFV